MLSENNLPISNTINLKALSSVFKYTSATYKFYWFLGILDSINEGKRKILKKEIFAKMVSNAWYPINYFKLSFGTQDKIATIISDLINSTALNVNDDKNKIENFLLNTQNDSIIPKLYYLDINVPHKFLSPWYKRMTKKQVYNSSQNDNQNSIYKLYPEYIIVNQNWYNYLTANSKVIRDFIYWNLTLFIQARNPNIPDVTNKLIKPGKRNSLNRQRKKFWNIYIQEANDPRCIFSNKRLDINNYHLDHFVPYSFVSHDLNWNLIPINPSFNVSKGNKLPLLNKHFDDFYKIQNEALKIIDYRLTKSFEEEYLQVFSQVYNSKSLDYDKLKNTIQPLIVVASNNGFEYLGDDSE